MLFDLFQMDSYPSYCKIANNLGEKENDSTFVFTYLSRHKGRV